MKLSKRKRNELLKACQESLEALLFDIEHHGELSDADLIVLYANLAWLSAQSIDL